LPEAQKQVEDLKSQLRDQQLINQLQSESLDQVAAERTELLQLRAEKRDRPKFIAPTVETPLISSLVKGVSSMLVQPKTVPSILDIINADQRVLILVNNLLNTGYTQIYFERPTTGKNDLNQYLMRTMKTTTSMPKLVNIPFQTSVTNARDIVVTTADGTDFGIKLFCVSSSKVETENAICSHILSKYSFTGQSTKENHYAERKNRERKKQLAKFQRSFDQANHEAHVKSQHTLAEEAHDFQTLMSDHGYTIHLLKKVPVVLVNRALEHYVNGYGLLHLGKIFRLNQQHIKLFGTPLPADQLRTRTISPQAGKKQRKLILRVWRDYLSKRHGITLKNPYFNQSSETDEEFEERIKDKTYLEKSSARSMRTAIKTNKGLMTDIATEVSTSVTDGLKAKVSQIFTSVGAKIEETFGIAPSYIKYGLIFVIVCGVLLTIMSVSTFVLLARSIFAVHGLMSEQGMVGQGQQEDEQEIANFVGEGVSHITKKYLGVDTSNIVSSINGTSRFLGSISTIATFVQTCCTLLSKALDYVWEKTLGVPFFSNSKAAHAILQSYENFYSQMMTLDLTEMTVDRSKATAFCKSYMQLQREFKDVDKSSLEAGVKGRMQQVLLAGYRTFCDVSTRLGNMHGRQQPVWVSFYGPPGAGKTVLSKGVVSAMAYGLGRKVDDHMVYYRNSIDEFWSGYHEEMFAVMVDDFLQPTDPQQRALIANEMIMMRNVCGYPLNMPSLDKKGTTFFMTPLIVTTSNCDTSRPLQVGLSDVGALRRRMDFNVHVELTAQAKQAGLTITDLDESTMDNYDLLLTERCDVAEPKTHVARGKLAGHNTPKQGRKITFSELINLIFIAYKANEAAHKRTMTKATWKSVLQDQMHRHHHLLLLKWEEVRRPEERHLILHHQKN